MTDRTQEAPFRPFMCDQCWGSHCCDLPARHFGVHQCGMPSAPCSQYVDTPEGPRARGARDDGTWGEWTAHVGGFRVGERPQ